MKTSDFDYNLPESLIAQAPAFPRDHSRLMVIDRSKETIVNRYFYNITDYFKKGDVLVLNNTKVFPARFMGKKSTGGKIEVLIIEEIRTGVWTALTTPGIKIGQSISFNTIKFTCISHEDRTILLETSDSKEKVLSVLQIYGLTPLPPYINSKDTEEKIRQEYQTIYAKIKGSVAAPTAGFHFTNDLMSKIKNIGVEIKFVTLHVGLGTFVPVKSEKLEDHKMHHEYFEVDRETVNFLNNAKKNGKRIFSVGTTTTRVLETLATKPGVLRGDLVNGSTNLFIYPPYKFNFVDALITNFHLPKSTLLSLVSAFVSSPNTQDKFTSFNHSLIGKAYKKAISEKYRFYSFGDASLIV